MLITMAPFAGATRLDDFSDANAVSEQHQVAMGVLVGMGVIEGDGYSVQPNRVVTRAEMTALIYRIVTGRTDGPGSRPTPGPTQFFTDIPADQWFAGYVNWAYVNNIVAGRGDGTFDPHSNVTVLEAASMLLRATGWGGDGSMVGPAWAINTSAVAGREGLYTSVNLSGGRENQGAPREVAAQLMFNALGVQRVLYTEVLGFWAQNPNFGVMNFGFQLEDTSAATALNNSTVSQSVTIDNMNMTNVNNGTLQRTVTVAALPGIDHEGHTGNNFVYVAPRHEIGRVVNVFWGTVGTDRVIYYVEVLSTDINVAANANLEVAQMRAAGVTDVNYQFNALAFQNFTRTGTPITNVTRATAFLNAGDNFARVLPVTYVVYDGVVQTAVWAEQSIENLRVTGAAGNRAVHVGVGSDTEVNRHLVVNESRYNLANLITHGVVRVEYEANRMILNNLTTATGSVRFLNQAPIGGADAAQFVGFQFGITGQTRNNIQLVAPGVIQNANYNQNSTFVVTGDWQEGRPELADIVTQVPDAQGNREPWENTTFTFYFDLRGNVIAVTQPEGAGGEMVYVIGRGNVAGHITLANGQRVAPTEMQIIRLNATGTQREWITVNIPVVGGVAVTVPNQTAIWITATDTARTYNMPSNQTNRVLSDVVLGQPTPPGGIDLSAANRAQGLAILAALTNTADATRAQITFLNPFSSPTTFAVEDGETLIENGFQIWYSWTGNVLNGVFVIMRDETPPTPTITLTAPATLDPAAETLDVTVAWSNLDPANLPADLAGLLTVASVTGVGTFAVVDPATTAVTTPIGSATFALTWNETDLETAGVVLGGSVTLALAGFASAAAPANVTITWADETPTPAPGVTLTPATLSANTEMALDVAVATANMAVGTVNISYSIPMLATAGGVIIELPASVTTTGTVAAATGDIVMGWLVPASAGFAVGTDIPVTITFTDSTGETATAVFTIVTV